jgi:hypothetical protein
MLIHAPFIFLVEDRERAVAQSGARRAPGFRLCFGGGAAYAANGIQ